MDGVWAHVVNRYFNYSKNRVVGIRPLSGRHLALRLYILYVKLVHVIITFIFIAMLSSKLPICTNIFTDKVSTFPLQTGDNVATL